MHIPEVLQKYMGGLTYLPFVRDSKLGDVKGTASASLAKPKAAEAKPVASVSDDPLTNSINSKAEEIRNAKTAKV